LSASDWHDKIYELATAANIETKEIFKAIYMALLKKPSGPRAGWLLASLDSEFLKERFESAGKIKDVTV
jgi:lysyl-tRNA synthetase class 1